MPTEDPLLARAKAARRAEKLRQQRITQSQSQSPLPLHTPVLSQTTGAGPSNILHHPVLSQTAGAESSNVMFPTLLDQIDG